MEFYGIFAGVAVRATGIDGTAGVNDPAGLIVKLAQDQLPVGSFGQGLAVLTFEYAITDGGAVIAGHADDADGADLIAGGYGSDGMGHKFLLENAECRMQSAK